MSPLLGPGLTVPDTIPAAVVDDVLGELAQAEPGPEEADVLWVRRDVDRLERPCVAVSELRSTLLSVSADGWAILEDYRARRFAQVARLSARSFALELATGGGEPRQVVRAATSGEPRYLEPIIELSFLRADGRRVRVCAGYAGAFPAATAASVAWAWCRRGVVADGFELVEVS